ncbi:MAG: lipoate--protein ligase family protein [Planctomycetota bacterium]|jgi:lipoate-protein ligase A
MPDLPLQLIVEQEPRRGSWNMAADECLLEVATSAGLRAVRMYQWSEPTVSLGYFQDEAEFRAENRFADLAAVRRLSGGGAILHHLELTYSLVLPAGDPLAVEPTLLYELVHDAILDVLRAAGIAAAMRGEDRKLAAEPFLCFTRGDRHDIVFEGHKIVGSAQRRRRGAVLQHGSLLLDASPHAEELPGVNDLSEAERLTSEIGQTLGQSIARQLGSVELIQDWPGQQAGRITELEEQQYARLDWGRRR